MWFASPSSRRSTASSQPPPLFLFIFSTLSLTSIPSLTLLSNSFQEVSFEPDGSRVEAGAVDRTKDRPRFFFSSQKEKAFSFSNCTKDSRIGAAAYMVRKLLLSLKPTACSSRGAQLKRREAPDGRHRCVSNANNPPEVINAQRGCGMCHLSSPPPTVLHRHCD